MTLSNVPIFRTTVSLLVVVTIGVAASFPNARAEDAVTTKKPNVIVILADDAGYADFSMHGSKTCPTPYIDSIAEHGIRFTDAYVTASVCSPSRAGFLTGRYQQRFGHEYNLRAGFGLPVEEKTVADAMKAAGYKTVALGKWHLGSSQEYHPSARGFDEFYGFLSGGRAYWPNKKKSSLIHNHKPVEETFDYLTSHLADRACEYIEQYKDQPFFMYVAFNAVHTPMHATDTDLRRIKGASNEKRRKLAAMTVSLDDAVGSILKKLRALDMEENTLLFFTNDNGGAYINESNNWPLRGTKGTPFEGGNRVPFAMQWPGRLPSGAVYRHPVSTLDILPTSLAAAGVDPTEVAAKPLDGVNLLPWIQPGADASNRPHETLYWRKGPRCWAIRRLDWKLVGYQDHSLMLFDLSKDAGERNDVAEKHPKIVSELRERYEAWSSQMAGPLWQQGKNYEFASERLQKTHMRIKHPGHDEERRQGRK